jgi:hypothetical protein
MISPARCHCTVCYTGLLLTPSVSDAAQDGRYSEGLLHAEEKFKRSRLACGGEKAPDRDAASSADLQGTVCKIE